jgi:hypothetical protein
MLTPVQMQRKREFRNAERKAVKKLYSALKNYPQQMRLRDQLIAYLKGSNLALFNECQRLMKRVEELEAKK